MFDLIWIRDGHVLRDDYHDIKQDAAQRGSANELCTRGNWSWARELRGKRSYAGMVYQPEPEFLSCYHNALRPFDTICYLAI